MDDNPKSSSELLKEISELHQRINELEAEVNNKPTENQNERILLKTLIENLPDLVYAKDKDCRKILANAADVQNVGKQSKAEVLGKNDFDLYPEEIARGFFEDDQKVIKTGQPVINREEYSIDPTGNKKWLLTSKFPIKDDAGYVTGLLGIGRDITEMMQGREVLQKERNLLRTLIENLPDLIYAKDKNGCKILANAADVQNCGKQSEAELLGKNDFELFPEEIARGFYEDDMKVIKTGEPIINREEYFIDSNGNKQWLLTSKLPLRDDNGNTIGLLGIGRNITEMVEAHDILQKERNLLRTLIDSLPDLIFFKDAQGNYILNNSAHLKHLGVKSQEEAAGKTIFDFYPIEKAEPLFQEEMEIVHTGKPIVDKEETTFSSNPGDIDYLLTDKIPIKDSQGKVRGILGVSHNITNRKKADEAIKKAYDELGKTNTDLKKANKVKGQFLANMSHEIRTPLNAIIGMTGLLLDTQLNAEQRDFAETIHNSGDILLSLINDILDFSKIEAQKIELEKQPFNVRNCVEESLDLIASKAAD
jgi:two-component system sensor histidine kinase/response regulator